MTPTKAKWIGIGTIAFVSFIQVMMSIFVFSFIIEKELINTFLLIDVSFLVVVLLSIWQSKNIEYIFRLKPSIKLNKYHFAKIVKPIITRITILAVICYTIFFIISSYINGVLFSDWLENNVMMVMLIFYALALGLYQVVSKHFGTPLAWWMLKQIKTEIH